MFILILNNKYTGVHYNHLLLFLIFQISEGKKRLQKVRQLRNTSCEIKGNMLGLLGLPITERPEVRRAEFKEFVKQHFLEVI